MEKYEGGEWSIEDTPTGTTKHLAYTLCEGESKDCRIAGPKPTGGRFSGMPNLGSVPPLSDDSAKRNRKTGSKGRRSQRGEGGRMEMDLGGEKVK